MALRRIGVSVVAAALVAGLVAPAMAHKKAHRQHHHVSGQHGGKSAHRPARVRYSGRGGVGYWRPGPETGYGFGFSSYKGDPFGNDDYYDGGRCYYQKHHDFCVANKIFDGTSVPGRGRPR